MVNETEAANDAIAAASAQSAPQKWEYFVTPLVLHNEAAILNNWGGQGWELVQIIPGPAGGNVAYLKRKA